MEHDLEDASQTGLLGTEGLLASPKAHLLDLTTQDYCSPWQRLSSKDDRLFSHVLLYNITLTLTPWAKSVAVDFPKMGHIERYGFHLVFLGCLPSEASSTLWGSPGYIEALHISLRLTTAAGIPAGDHLQRQTCACIGLQVMASPALRSLLRQWGADEHSPLRHDSHITWSIQVNGF